ncbi:DUF4845 domain-containing protein [Isoalcanivorax indicus]|uniref:DUF4845 domain-containing protein n=1 Tax=Isoalcanivorax indicus TaxID=2202653 RepID=UPI001FE67539|nr:DUF4845 domain-containing protein [Isoalcanivorax indicus]
MTTLPSRMRGLSMVGWMVVIVIAVVLGTAAIRIIPAYLEYSTINTAINNTLQDSRIIMQSDNEIRQAIDRRFSVNNVTAVSSRDLAISKDGGRLHIGLDYEVREPLFGNIDLVIAFQKDYEKSTR